MNIPGMIATGLDWPRSTRMDTWEWVSPNGTKARLIESSGTLVLTSTGGREAWLPADRLAPIYARRFDINYSTSREAQA